MMRSIPLKKSPPEGVHPYRITCGNRYCRDSCGYFIPRFRASLGEREAFVVSEQYEAVRLGIDAVSQDYDELTVPIRGGSTLTYFVALRVLMDPYVKNDQFYICPSAENIKTATLSYSYNWCWSDLLGRKREEIGLDSVAVSNPCFHRIERFQ